MNSLATKVQRRSLENFVPISFFNHRLSIMSNIEKFTLQASAEVENIFAEMNVGKPWQFFFSKNRPSSTKLFVQSKLTKLRTFFHAIRASGEFFAAPDWFQDIRIIVDDEQATKHRHQVRLSGFAILTSEDPRHVLFYSPRFFTLSLFFDTGRWATYNLHSYTRSIQGIVALRIQINVYRVSKSRWSSRINSCIHK